MKNMIELIAIGIVIGIIIGIGTAIVIINRAEASSKEAAMGWVVCQPDSFVNIREKPSKHAIECGRLYLGDDLIIDQWRSGWVHATELSNEMGQGWINAGYVDYHNPIIYDDPKTMITAKGAVNARMCVGGKRRCRLKKGEAVKVFAISENWAVTDKGFIKAELLTNEFND